MLHVSSVLTHQTDVRKGNFQWRPSWIGTILAILNLYCHSDTSHQVSDQSD